jgi:hypothetical protein
MEEIDSATTSTEPAPSDEADSTHDSVSANGKTYRFNPQWLKTFNWLVYDQSKKSMFCNYYVEVSGEGWLMPPQNHPLPPLRQSLPGT